MTPERQELAFEIFDAAIARPEAERESFVGTRCADDEELGAEVRSLLAAHVDASGFLSRGGRWPSEAVAGVASSGSPGLQPGDRLAPESEAKALTIGTKLGPYEILAGIGAGGMGEVYKARDTRLNRTVAVKVLSANTARDPQFRRRFQQEARAIAALNHPGICTLYDVGQHEEIDYLVMEYLDGETLASRLIRGPLPVDLVLTIGSQIADALEKAHRVGITHRDLKPANVMLTSTGVKLLDFGLAREGLVHGETGMSTSPLTLTALTGREELLGTLQYMAPEVLEGRRADARSDIFAFGCVLREMVTGRRTFDGATQAAIIAAVLNVEPPSLLTRQGAVPLLFDLLVLSCLAKDPDRRAQSISDVKRELAWVAEVTSAPAPAPRSRVATPIAFAMLFIGALTALGAAWAWKSERPPSAVRNRVARFAIQLEDGWQVEGRPAISPDGSRIAYVARPSTDAEARQLFVRALDRLESQSLDGTVGAGWPFFSPDGQRIGYFHSGGLSIVPASGGVPRLISSTGHLATDASWGTDDQIVFPPTIFSGLRRVSVSGGPLATLTSPDSAKGEVGHLSPELLPGNRSVLLTVTDADSPESSRIAVYDFGVERGRTLIEGGNQGRYTSSGHLVYARRGTLLAVPFDMRTGSVRGAPVAVLSGVRHAEASYFAVAQSGTLVYTEGDDERHLSTPVLLAPDGTETPLQNAVVGEYFDPNISPDGRHVAFSIRVGYNQDIWVHDVVRGTWSRLTKDPAADMAPVWVAAGSRIVYSSRAGDSVDLFSVPSDGSGEPTALFRSDGWKFGGSWSESQKILAFQASPKGVYGAVGSDLWLLRLSGTPVAEPFFRTRSSEHSPSISPNGRWVAYSSDESGRREVYVRPLSGPARKWLISSDGGQHPRWTKRGEALLYVSGDRIMRATVTASPQFTAGIPRTVVTLKYYGGVSVPNYELWPDGRLLTMREAPAPPAVRRLVVVENWTAELRSRAPP